MNNMRPSQTIPSQADILYPIMLIAAAHTVSAWVFGEIASQLNDFPIPPESPACWKYRRF